MRRTCPSKAVFSRQELLKEQITPYLCFFLNLGDCMVVRLRAEEQILRMVMRTPCLSFQESEQIPLMFLRRSLTVRQIVFVYRKPLEMRF